MHYVCFHNVRRHPHCAYIRNDTARECTFRSALFAVCLRNQVQCIERCRSLLCRSEALGYPAGGVAFSLQDVETLAGSAKAKAIVNCLTKLEKAGLQTAAGAATGLYCLRSAWNC